MAIGFGAGPGVASTDRITGPTEAIPAQFSFHVRTNRNGEGGNTVGRIFDRGPNTFCLANDHGNAANTYAFGNLVGTRWRWTRPSGSVWAPIGVSVDTSSSANDPIIYQEGTKLTVGSGLTQVGADAAYTTASTSWTIGNRSDAARNWDGSLAEMAWWDVILTDDEFFALQKGVSPDQIRPEALQHYLPMVRSGAIDKLGAPATVTDTDVTDHPRIILPHRHISRTRITGSGQNLSGAASTQSNASSTGAISIPGVLTLTGAASVQSNAGSAASITQAHVLVQSATVDSGASSTGVMSITFTLTGAACTQSNISSTGSLFASALTPQQAAWLEGLALLHGLVAASPLSVSASARSSGAVTQTISDVAGTVTVTTTSAPSGAAGTSALSPTQTQWLEDLARIYGLIDPLVVTATTRGDGTLSQTISEAGGTTTVTRI